MGKTGAVCLVALFNRAGLFKYTVDKLDVMFVLLGVFNGFEDFLVIDKFLGFKGFRIVD